MIPTLYLTRNGLFKPLGQSQVMAYLRGLLRSYAVTLITYEKDEDSADVSRMLSGWFRLDWLSSFLSVVAGRDPDVAFQLTTRDDPDQVRASLPADLSARVLIAPSASERVQEALHEQFASVMFFTDGLSKSGSSPTRMGEILGCGLPVVANEGVGDVARIVRDHRVGVLARGAAPEDMAVAWEELQALLADPELAARCRSTAEQVFSLEKGTETYRTLYARILSG